MDSVRQLKTDMINTDSQYVSCPYNPSHRILRARLQYHLVKCRRNVKEKPEEEKVICPLDATHHVNKEELAEHMKVCPNRKIVDSERYLIDSEALEPATSYKLPDMPPCEENWDDPSEQAYTYDPTPHLENQPILRTMHGATKSERKIFRQVERMKMIQFQSGQPMNTDLAAAAVGVTIANGKFVGGRGRGHNRTELGKGSEGLGPAKNKVDLGKIVGDGVGRTLPVEVAPLRQPRQQSMALRLVQCGSSDGDKGASYLGEKSPTSSPSKTSNSKQTEITKGADVGHKQPEKLKLAPAKNNNKKPPLAQDWWNQNNNTSDKVNTAAVDLEEYKRKIEDSRLAARMGLSTDESIVDDNERARDFTYLDDEWQVQGRRGRVARGTSNTGQTKKSLGRGRNW